MTKSERIKILEIQVEALQKQVKELQASGRWWNFQPNPIVDPCYTSTRTVWLNSGDCDDTPPGPFEASKESQEDREDIADAKAALAEWEIVNNKSYGNVSNSPPKTFTR